MIDGRKITCPSCFKFGLRHSHSSSADIHCEACGEVFVRAPRLPSHDESWALARQDAVDRLSDRIEKVEKSVQLIRNIIIAAGLEAR